MRLKALTWKKYVVLASRLFTVWQTNLCFALSSEQEFVSLFTSTSISVCQTMATFESLVWPPYTVDVVWPYLTSYFSIWPVGGLSFGCHVIQIDDGERGVAFVSKY